MNQGVVKKAAFVASIFKHLEAFHLPFMEELQRSGFEVHAYARRDDGMEHVQKLGVVCHEIEIRRNPLQPGNLKAFQQLVASFRKERFELVHVHTPVAGILGRAAAKLTGVPLVVYTAHGFHFYSGASLVNWGLYYPVEYFMSRFTDVLVTINLEDFQRGRKFPVRQKTCFVPGVGLDVDKYRLPDEKQARSEVREELGISRDDFTIIYLAELNENKNQKQLLQAIRLLKEQGYSVKCLFVGSGQIEGNLQELVRELGVDEQVQFLGFRRDVPRLLAASDVCSLLSMREGLPRSLMEAMAAGKPIVATNIRGNRDLVSDGESGFLVPLHNPYETAAAFKRLVENPEDVITMGQKSRESAERYSLPVILGEMKRIYQGADDSVPRQS